MTHIPSQAPSEPSRTTIDDILEVARSLTADRKDIPLIELREAYRRKFPGGASDDSVDATLNSHCINMKSRFPKPKEPKATAPWLTRPLFKRVDRGVYRLLTEVELAWFKAAVKADDPVIYRDEYQVPR